MTPSLTSARLLGVIALLAACNPYNPDLGYEPFKCGESEPRCPRDYTCLEFGEGEAICQKTGVEAPDAGSSELECNDDGEIEPNEVLAQAFPTGIPGSPSFELVGLAICPKTDVDLFFVEVATGASLTATLTYRASRGELKLDVLDAQGTSIKSGTSTEEAPNTVTAEVADMSAGSYFVQVRAGDSAENNYESIAISVADGG
jgi:hypothetical protein